MNIHSPNVTTLRAALCLRVSTARQAEHDISIPTKSVRAKPIAGRAAVGLSKASWSRGTAPPKWRARRDSNPWPLPSEGSALSS